MTYTNDLKSQHEDQLVDWVMDKKFDDMCDYCNGDVFVHEDNYEAMIEYYMEENMEALWEEYFDQLESKHQDDAHDAVVEDQLTQE